MVYSSIILFYCCVLHYTTDICNNNDEDEKYLIQTHSQAKTSSTKLLEVHGIKKELYPNLRPEKQHAIPKQDSSEKPWVGQGRAGLRRMEFQEDPI